MSLQVKLYDEYQRINPQTGGELEPGSPALKTVALAAGRGEFASFQVVLGPFGRAGQSTATVKASALKGKNGTIPARQYDLLAEWYVHSGKPRTTRRAKVKPKLGPAADKFVPDALVPLKVYGGQLPLGLPGNDVPKQKYQGLWVDLFVPKGTRPGVYEGKLTVTAAGETCEVPVCLTVDKFTQPDEPGFTFLMNNYCDSISSGWKELHGDLDRHTKPLYRRVERNFWRAAHDHRCVFYYLPYSHSGYIYPTFSPELEGGGPNKRVKSWKVWDQHFGGYFDGSAFKGTRRGEVPVSRFFLPISVDWPADFLKWHRPGYADEFKAVMSQFADHFKAKGWTKTTFDMFLNHKQRFKLFPWDCEEVRFQEDNEVHRYFRTLWEGTLDHKTTAPVRFDYTNGDTWIIHEDLRSDLAEFTDVFICGSRTTSTDQPLTEKLRKKGTHFCLCGGGAAMADSIRATAFWPLQFWMWGGDSFMVWLSMEWGEDPYKSQDSNGRLTFLYPGDRFGLEEPLPSLRLKTVRNVLQTIERLEDAFGKGALNAPARRKAGAAMGIPLKKWFPDPDPDFSGSEEKPVAGWGETTLDQFRKLSRLALTGK